MKIYLTIATFYLFFIPSSYAQFVMTGIAKSNIINYQKGDTLLILGMKPNMNKEHDQYLIQDGSSDVFISSKRIDLLPQPLDFWEMEWFKHKAADYRKKGWEYEKRELLREDALDYYLQARDNQMIFEDELLYDYLYQLIHKIHPSRLIKEQASNLTVLVIKSTEKLSFSFDNGSIVLTTGLLAGTNSEAELIYILTNNIAHVTLEHNLINLNQQLRAERRANIWASISAVSSSVAMTYSNHKYGSTFDANHALDIAVATHFVSSRILEAIGAEYSKEQLLKAETLTKTFLNSHELSELSEKNYLIEIAGAISYTAWQEYHLMNYDKALDLINKLYSNDLATEEDFLLLSKLKRRLSNNIHSNLQALNFIREANTVGLTNLVDLDKEAGMIYLRMKDHENAKIAFHKYKDGLLKMEKEGLDIAEDLKYVNQLLFKYQMLD